MRLREPATSHESITMRCSGGHLNGKFGFLLPSFLVLINLARSSQPLNMQSMLVADHLGGEVHIEVVVVLYINFTHHRTKPGLFAGQAVK